MTGKSLTTSSWCEHAENGNVNSEDRQGAMQEKYSIDGTKHGFLEFVCRFDEYREQVVDEQLQTVEEEKYAFWPHL